MIFVTDTIDFVTRLSTDTLLVIFLIAGLSILALYLGKDWITSFIFSLFVANWFYILILFELPESPWYVFGTKVIIAIVIVFVLKKFIKSDFPYKNSKKYIQAVLLGLTATMTLMVTGLAGAYQFSPFISRWFEQDFLFWTSLVPLLTLFLLIKK